MDTSRHSKAGLIDLCTPHCQSMMSAIVHIVIFCASGGLIPSSRQSSALEGSVEVGEQGCLP